jgi:hypothetical protein
MYRDEREMVLPICYTFFSLRLGVPNKFIEVVFELV